MTDFGNGDGVRRGANISDEMVSKVGKVVGRIVEIKQAFRAGMAMAKTDEEKKELSRQAEMAATQAISAQGLSIEEYNEVVTAADDDPDLEQRLLTIARQS